MMIAMIAVAISLPFAAAADTSRLVADCTMAIRRGDKAEVTRIAETLLTSSERLARDDTAAAIECVEAATGVVHTYNRAAGSFHAWGAVADRNAREAEAERVEAERRAAAEEAAARLAADKAEREARVYDRLVEGCEALYRRRPDETVANPMCFNLFLTTGLPSD